MKKVFFALALVMGLGTTVAFASNLSSTEVTTVTNVNDFTPVEVKDLPKAVQDVLANSYKDFTIKAAAVETAEDGTSVYQITLVNAEGEESVVLFNEKGEVVK
ncbi:hypothetical protein [uncultured Bacteroides sp.]|uniref:PepSY domain-containing protein n=1 Tax=Candidatus Phocaeicola faecigallinarum TaxID=2838732 RepID=A0A948X0B8_9BACT|nr:hypothetical protein [uncultured Bacteroides sp.]MBU3839338.1 hypothetical protein [Candidatus Phocaeicola faecigallinarum]